MACALEDVVERPRPCVDCGETDPVVRKHLACDHPRLRAVLEQPCGDRAFAICVGTRGTCRADRLGAGQIAWETACPSAVTTAIGGSP
jgi:hypothetical protein